VLAGRAAARPGERALRRTRAGRPGRASKPPPSVRIIVSISPLRAASETMTFTGARGAGGLGVAATAGVAADGAGAGASRIDAAMARWWRSWSSALAQYFAASAGWRSIAANRSTSCWATRRSIAIDPGLGRRRDLLAFARFERQLLKALVAPIGVRIGAQQLVGARDRGGIFLWARRRQHGGGPLFRNHVVGRRGRGDLPGVPTLV
jgi:hypothetical protein